MVDGGQEAGAELTSEVALMNMHGVSLGADSMVTLGRLAGGEVTQPTSQKITVINAQAPIAAMTNNYAAFAGVRWNLVLERFGVHCGSAPLAFEDYGEQLAAFLADFDTLSGLAGYEDHEVDGFYDYIESFTLIYARRVFQLARHLEAHIGEGLARAALGQLRDEILLLPAAESGDDADDDAGPVAREQIEPTPRLIAFVEAHLPAALERALALAFRNSAIPEAIVPELEELAVQSILVDWLPRRASRTQLILAGFGAGALTPSLLAMNIAGAFAGRLKYAITDRVDASADRQVFIKTFAQAQLGNAILHGARPDFESIALQESRDELLDLVYRALSRTRLSERTANALAQDILMGSRTALERGMERAKAAHAEHAYKQFGPLLRTADAAALARFAHRFVEVTVLEAELLRNDGVGRPIRVVTLTRDGIRTDIDGEKA